MNYVRGQVLIVKDPYEEPTHVASGARVVFQKCKDQYVSICDNYGRYAINMPMPDGDYIVNVYKDINERTYAFDEDPYHEGPVDPSSKHLILEGGKIHTVNIKAQIIGAISPEDLGFVSYDTYKDAMRMMPEKKMYKPPEKKQEDGAREIKDTYGLELDIEDAVKVLNFIIPILQRYGPTLVRWISRLF